MSAWVPEHDKRQSKASAKVKDAINISKLGLKSHQAARDLVITESDTTRTSTTWKNTSTGTHPAPTTTSSQSISVKRKLSASVHDVEDEDLHAVPKGINQTPVLLQLLIVIFSQLQLQRNPVLCYLMQRNDHRLKTLNRRHPPFHWKTKQRMLMHFSIHQKRSVKSHEEHVFFASMFEIPSSYIALTSHKPP